MTKTKMLYREDIDTLQCSSPGCDHTAHDGKMYFHQNCHKYKGVVLQNDGDHMDVKCAVCGRFIVSLAFYLQKKDRNICHEGEPMFLSYMNGMVMLECGECETIISGASLRKKERIA